MPVPRMVTISMATARWLFEIGRRLVREGTGNYRWDPRDEYLIEQDENTEGVGYIEEFELGTPQYAWAEAMIMVLRTLVATVAYQVGDELPMTPPSELTDSLEDNAEI